MLYCRTSLWKSSKKTVIHFLTEESPKSRRPLRCTPAAEIIVASDALDKIVSVRTTLSDVFETPISLAILETSTSRCPPNVIQQRNHFEAMSELYVCTTKLQLTSVDG